MAYIRLQNYTNVVVGKHGTQIFEVVVVVLLLFAIVVCCFCPQMCTSLIIFGQVVCSDRLECQF